MILNIKSDYEYRNMSIKARYQTRDWDWDWIGFWPIKAKFAKKGV